jgi:hypothetical protein
MPRVTVFDPFISAPRSGFGRVAGGAALSLVLALGGASHAFAQSDYPPPPGQAPQAYQAPPPGYQAPQGYPPPQGYPQPQGYPAQQGYPPPQGYPAPQGYPPPPGYPPQAYAEELPPPPGAIWVGGPGQCLYGNGVVYWCAPGVVFDGFPPTWDFARYPVLSIGAGIIVDPIWFGGWRVGHPGFAFRGRVATDGERREFFAHRDEILRNAAAHGHDHPDYRGHRPDEHDHER